MPEELSSFLVRLIICFLIGSIPFSVLAMVGSGINIQQVGSGNPGFNNVLRVSKSRAVFALLGDLGKGYLSLWMFYSQEDSLILGWIYGFAIVLGHCYSPLLKCKGGKGIATSGGVMLFLYPVWAFLALAAFILIRLVGSRMKWSEAGAIASISSWFLFLIVLLITANHQDALYATCMIGFLFWKHRKNFQNLRSTV